MAYQIDTKTGVPLVLVSTLVVLLVANTGENPLAVLASIRLLPSVSAHVHHQIALLIERS